MEDKNQELEFLKTLPDTLYNFLVDFGLSHTHASWLDELVAISIIFGVAICIGLIIDKVLFRIIYRIAKIAKVKWDDVLLTNKTFHYVTNIIPAIIIYISIPLAIRSDFWVEAIKNLASIYIIIQILRAISAGAKSLTYIYSKRDNYSNKPIQIFFQIITVISFFIGGLMILGIIIDQSLTNLMAGLGASMAILMLIFKDSILGFVSGWQLSTNDQLRIGDWITLPKYGADGNVIEMSLYSIKVKNFDNTIVTIPPYALISESFQNWRGMEESGGRRIKRFINIDIKTVKFCDQQMLERLSKIALLKDYLIKKEEEIAKHNKEEGNTVLRRQTNIGIFRAYINEYIYTHPEINTNLTLMVRQLQPTEKGIPLEVYCFAKNKSWVYYEGVQSDIFDHIISMAPTFDLEIFQYPSSIPFS